MTAAEYRDLARRSEKFLRDATTALYCAAEMREAVEAWWLSHRPLGWTEEQHHANPYVNQSGRSTEKALARTLLGGEP